MRKIALLVGISDYEEGLEALPSAVKDVAAMQQVLVNPEMGDFAAADVTVLTNPPRQEMTDAIYTLFANRQKDDLVLLYFSGHGILDEANEFYFSTRITRKVQGKLLPTTAVSAHDIRGWMEQSRSQRKVIVLDSCFSGAFAKGVKAKDGGSVNPERFLGGQGIAIMTASTSTQYALTQDGFDLSIYTHYLVEGIRTGGADRDNDGMISVEELHAYAKEKVQAAAPAMTPEFYPFREGGHKILLAKSPPDDPRLRYRKEVEKRVDQGTFSVPARRHLRSLQTSLPIDAAIAAAIEAEVCQPYQEFQRKRQEYEDTLLEMVQAETVLSDRVLTDLNDYQVHLGLRDEDVQTIRDRILPAVAPDLPLPASAPAAQPADPSEPSVPTSVQAPETFTAAPPVQLSERQRQRLASESDALQSEWDVRAEKLAQLRQAYAIEAGTAHKYQLEQEIKAEETQLTELENKLAKIEQTLSPVAAPPPTASPPTHPTFEFETATIDQNLKITRRPGRAEFFRAALGKGVELDMVKIPGGQFMMGAGPNEEGASESEYPQHQGTIAPFYLGKYPVTQAQWAAIAALPKINRNLKLNPSHFNGRDRPVEQISWEEAVEFCDRLSQQTGRTYRLPSEAEWEYACRAATTTPFYFGKTITADLAKYGGQATTSVGTFPPNAFGLYDMHGNAWEWCADHWHRNYEGAPIDGSAWLSDVETSKYLLRGGSWLGNPEYCRSAYRNFVSRDVRNIIIGFRVSCAAARILP